MPLFKFTVKHNINSNNVVLQKGMSVEIPTATSSNPLLSNGGKEVQRAFMRIYGIDIKKAGALNGAYLDVEMI